MVPSAFSRSYRRIDDRGDELLCSPSTTSQKKEGIFDNTKKNRKDGNTHRTSDVNALRFAQSIEVPSAPAHTVSDFQRVDIGVLTSERDDRCRRIA
jgi:hypothetical protein